MNNLLAIPVNGENPDPRVMCIVLADVSGSMFGEPIAALEKGYSAFVDYVTHDDLARKRAEVAVITFGTHAEVRVPLQEGRTLEPVHFQAGGSTDMAAAINLAIDLIEQRKQEYKSSGIQYFRPWLVLFTDGGPNLLGFDEAVTRLNSLESAKAVTVFPIGVGDSVDYDKLSQVSTVRAPAPLSGLKFEEFFEWLSASLGNMANSNGFGSDDREVANKHEQVVLPPIGWTSV